MRRLGFSLLILLLLAACSSAPQRVSRSSGSYSTASSGSAYHTPPPGFPNFVDHSVGREEISIQAMSLVGIPYRWGGNTPDSGFDCSGLVRYVVARSASVNLPRTTADMSGSGESIEPDEVAPGDLIFFNTTGRPHSHVGIYVGKLRFVNAPSTGGTVRIDYLTNPYWAKRFDGIRRVAAPTHAPAPFEAPTYQVSNPPDRMAAPVEPQESSASYAGGGSSQQPVAESRPGYGYAAVPEPVAAPAQSQQTFQPQRVATTMQVPLTTSAIQPAPQSAAAPSADAFEPPPPIMSAAQMQAREAGAVTPTAVSSGTLRTQTDTAGMGTVSRVPAATANADTADAPVRSPVPASVARAPDPIDAAADAFEPPPPASVAVRQEQQAGPSGGVQIMRASTGSRAIPAPTQSGDDPIAHFATGNF